MRTRSVAGAAPLRTAQFHPPHFQLGDAMALPFADDTFDAAVMPLVIFFVPKPARGVAEMARVVCPGGIVAAYGWDMLDGGFPYEALWAEMRAMGVDVPLPPSPEASRIEVMRELWSGAGLVGVETREIFVQRSFADFDDYWTTIHGGPSVSRGLAKMAAEDRAILKTRMRERLPADAAGKITCHCAGECGEGKGAELMLRIYPLFCPIPRRAIE